MSVCAKCGKENENPDNLFCVFCGAKFESRTVTSEMDRSPVSPDQEVSCKNCGSIIPKGNDFCTSCGTAKNMKSVSPPSSQTKNPASNEKNAVPSTPPKKNRGPVIAVLTVLLAVCLAVSAVFLYAAINGADTLPIVGRFFARDSRQEEEVSAGERSRRSASEDKERVQRIPMAETEESEEAPDEIDEIQTAETPEDSSLISATSELPGYPAVNIVDADNDTAWAAEVDESGYWGSVRIPFGTNVTMYGIYLKNGNWKSQYDLIRNHRVQTLKVTFDDGSSEVLNVSDSALSSFAQLTTSDGEGLAFARPHTSSTLTITILDVYPGAEDLVFITGVSVALLPIPEDSVPHPETQPVPAPEPIEPAAGSGGMAQANEYILSFSSSRALTDGDLRSLSKEELRIARNEIYARYGRQFNDETLQAYFNGKSWYAGLTKLPAGEDPVLTALEIANIELIRVYEGRQS